MAGIVSYSGIAWAQVDATVGGTIGLPAQAQKAFVLENSYDFEANAQSGGTVVQLINVPSNCFVQQVALLIVTGEAPGSVALSVGDGSDTNGYFDAVAASNAAVFASQANVLAAGSNNTYGVGYGGGKMYTAADTIDVIPSGDISNALIRLKALVIDYGERN